MADKDENDFDLEFDEPSYSEDEESGASSSNDLDSTNPEDNEEDPESIANNIQQATGQNAQSILEDVFKRPPTQQEIYRLHERFASFIIWNGGDLRLADVGQKIDVKGVHETFEVYEFEVCFVAKPVALYSDDRGVSEAVQTAQALARMVHDREWNPVEFSGYDKMARAAWFQIQSLNMQRERQVNVSNFTPPEVGGTPEESPAKGKTG